MKPATKGIRRTNQEIERGYFELFQKAYRLPAGKILYGDRPDVTIMGAQTLGIETTNFYLDNGDSEAGEQKQSRRRESTISLAHGIYMANGGKNVEFHFGFDEARPIADMKIVARNIAALASELEDRVNGQVSRREYGHIPELAFVYLYARQLQYGDESDPEFPTGQPDPAEDFTAFARYRNRREERALTDGVYKPLPFPAKWRLTQVRCVGLMSTERLEEIVRKKERKAKEYAHCDAYWLLVVVDSFDPAQEQEIRVDGLTMTSDIFERVIVYEPRFEHIAEITPHG